METFSTLLAICAGKSPVPGEFPAQRPVTRNFDVFFDLRLNKKWVNNREAGDLRRYHTHCDVTVMVMVGQLMFRWWLGAVSSWPSFAYMRHEKRRTLYYVALLSPQGVSEVGGGGGGGGGGIYAKPRWNLYDCLNANSVTLQKTSK